MSGAVTVGYQANNCSGFDTTLGSMISATNSHVGNPAAYTTKICASASSTPQTISFSISNNIIGFGALSAVQTRYASADTNGTTSTSTDAHTISIASNASGGYSMTINGTTLTCSSCTNGATIAAIGSSPVAPSVGIEQFGMRITRNSGTGTTTAPYNTTNWALDTAAFPGTVVTGTGDSNTSVFGVKYMTSIATISEAGVYNALITYTVTSSF